MKASISFSSRQKPNAGKTSTLNAGRTRRQAQGLAAPLKSGRKKNSQLASNTSLSQPKSLQQRLFALSAMILLSLLLCGLGIYAVSLTLDHEIAQKTQKARWIDEQNQALEVELGRLQSFQKVENAAVKIPQLHVSTDTALEVPVGQLSIRPLPKQLQVSKPALLPVYHY